MYSAKDLHKAIEDNCLSDVAAIVERGIGINCIEGSDTAFTKAVSKGHYEAAGIIMNSKSFNPEASDRYGRTPLFVAASHGYVEFVDKLLKMEVEVDAANKIGITPLGACADNDCHESAKLLIQYGANINEGDPCGETPLHLACLNLCTNLVRVLIEHDCDVNAKDDNMKTPLMDAPNLSFSTPYHGISTSLSICQMLIGAGADFNAQDISGKTALHHAVDKNDICSVCVLAESGCKLDIPDEDGFTPFSQAICHINPRYEVARYLLYYGADPNQEVYSISDDSLTMSPMARLLERSVTFRNHFPEWSRALLLQALQGAVYPSEVYPNKADVPLPGGDEDSEETALPLSWSVDKEMLEWLRSDVPCSFQHQARLSIRRTLGYTNVMPSLNVLPTATPIKEYISLGVHPNSMPISKLCELYISIEGGNSEMVREIVASGMNINVYLTEKMPLDFALAVKNTEAAEIILKTQSSSQSEMNSVLESLLHIVAKHGYMPGLEDAIRLSESIDVKNADGLTPLHVAVHKGHFDVANALIEKGVDISSGKDDPSPVIHLAAASGSAEFVELLLKKGADPNSVDKFGNTPLHVAATKGADYKVRLYTHIRNFQYYSVADDAEQTESLTDDTKFPINHASVIVCLLKNGADPNKVNGQNKTALERARERPSTDILNLLENRP